MDVKASIMIHNAPDHLYRWTVVRACDDGLWYYGTYEDKARAELAASELDNGIMVVIQND